MNIRKACFWLFLACITFHICYAAGTNIALKGATLYPSPIDRAIVGGIIVIEDGKIQQVGPTTQVKIPPDAEVIDCSGMFITAGYQNSHVHFTEEKWANAGSLPVKKLQDQLQEMLASYGFTSVPKMIWPPAAGLIFSSN